MSVYTTIDPLVRGTFPEVVVLQLSGNDVDNTDKDQNKIEELALKLLNTFCVKLVSIGEIFTTNRIAMNRDWSNQKANPALKTKTGNK